MSAIIVSRRHESQQLPLVVDRIGVNRMPSLRYYPFMPTISQFFGILIHMYIRGEHNPPHFHALYAEHEAQINIQTLEVIEGKLPRRAMVMVLE